MIVEGHEMVSMMLQTGEIHSTENVMFPRYSMAFASWKKGMAASPVTVDGIGHCCPQINNCHCPGLLMFYLLFFTVGCWKLDHMSSSAMIYLISPERDHLSLDICDTFLCFVTVSCAGQYVSDTLT